MHQAGSEAVENLNYFKKLLKFIDSTPGPSEDTFGLVFARPMLLSGCK